MTLPTIIGMFGVLTVLIAYGAMTLGRIASDSLQYQWLNIIGTAGILISLIDQWNLPAYVANVAWIGIGALSLVRIYRKKRSAQ